MARPKKNITTAEVQWRVPTELLDWGRAEAERSGLEPGQWLTRLLEAERAGTRATRVDSHLPSPGPTTAATGLNRDRPINPRPKARDAR